MSNKDFERSIENATLKIIQNVAKNMKKACLVVERDAKIECPIDQGPLRASISNDVNITSSEIVGTVFSSSEIAPYVHQGTGIYAVDGNGRKTPWKYEVKAGKYKGWHTTEGQEPQPFLDKAKLKNKDKISKILAGV
ncbi:MAG: HK97 gp10 family phage protein [Bacilli bacterium]